MYKGKARKLSYLLIMNGIGKETYIVKNKALREMFVPPNENEDWRISNKGEIRDYTTLWLLYYLKNVGISLDMLYLTMVIGEAPILLLRNC